MTENKQNAQQPAEPQALTPAQLAEIGFKAYDAQAGGKTWDGKPTPAWPDLGDKVRANWEAAARAIADALTSQK